jgi:hypothetical protein
VQAPVDVQQERADGGNAARHGLRLAAAGFRPGFDPDPEIFDRTFAAAARGLSGMARD